MTGQKDKPISAVRLLHILGSVALGLAFFIFAWKNHPVREAWKHQKAQQEARQAGLPKTRPSGFAGALGGGQGRGFAAQLPAYWPYIWPDLALGSGILVLFIVATGVYAKRLEIWLEVHGSGQLASLRGKGIDAQALGMNKDRRGGVIK